MVVAGDGDHHRSCTWLRCLHELSSLAVPGCRGGHVTVERIPPLLGGLTHDVAGAGDLQGDGGDGAGVGEVGALEQFSGAGEEARGRGDDVGGVVVDRLDELPVADPCRADCCCPELLLAAGEEVVQGPVRGVAGGENRFDARAGVALAAKQVDAGLEDPLVAPSGFVVSSCVAPSCIPSSVAID